MHELKALLDRLSTLSTDSWEKFSNLSNAKTLKKAQFYTGLGQTAKEIGFLSSA